MASAEEKLTMLWLPVFSSSFSAHGVRDLVVKLPSRGYVCNKVILPV
jgi:hypothetical protein